MKIIKLIAGGFVVMATYNVGKLVGGFKVAKTIADELDEMFPGYKKTVTKLASEKLIDSIFDKTDPEESQ